MTTQTNEARVVAEGAVSAETAVGRLDGQNDILIRVVEEQSRQTRENYQRLDAKIDKLLYGILGFAGLTIVTIIGSVLTAIFARL